VRATWWGAVGLALAAACMPGPKPPEPLKPVRFLLINDVYVADTLGELGLFYRLAPVAFVGKSLVRGGGQNPLEAAQLGCPVLFGPHMENFEELAAGLLRAGGARRVADGAELAAAVALLLENRAARAQMATCARAAAASQGGALEATLGALAPLLERTLGPVDAGA